MCMFLATFCVAVVIVFVTVTFCFMQYGVSYLFYCMLVH